MPVPVRLPLGLPRVLPGQVGVGVQPLWLVHSAAAQTRLRHTGHTLRAGQQLDPGLKSNLEILRFRRLMHAIQKSQV